MTVAITGADGFAGSHLADYLAERGEKVIACVRTTPVKNLRPHKNVHVVYADLLDYLSLTKAFWGVDSVYHLGAVSGIIESRDKPFVTVKANVNGTQNVLSAAAECDVATVLYASTCHVMGYDVYAASKRAAEQICEAYRSKIDIVITRAYNHYGPRQRPEWVIPDFIDKALRSVPIVVNSPKAVRDFSYVKDIVAGYVVCMNKAEELIHEVEDTHPIELGSGQGITMHDLAYLVQKTVGSGEIQLGVPRTADLEVNVADPSKAESLGWKHPTKLEDGLKETVEWYRKRYDSAK